MRRTELPSTRMSLWPLVAALVFVLPATLYAYGGDTHYYLRFATALETCFDWDEAHLIASADYMLDKNRATTAEKQPVQSHNKVNWHAFGHSEERFNELWQRVEQETDPELQLVKLGQFLHFASDWESHYGYGVRMGHGLPTVFGFDPDSLANDEMNNFRMLGQTLNHMMHVCVMQERKTAWSGDPDRHLAELADALEGEALIRELHEFNSKKWKRWGYRGKKAKAILAKNHLLIEELIERRGRGHPERNIPSDFTPGDPQRGLPPPIGIRYNDEAEIVAVYGVEIQLAPEYHGSPMNAVEEERFEESEETELVDDLEMDAHQEEDLDLFSNVELEVVDVDLAENGWRIEAVVRNLGSGPSTSGALDLFVVHLASEEVLGQVSEPVPELAGGERLEIDLLVPSESEPGKEILVGATLRVADLSAQSNDLWFAPWKDAISGEFGKKKRKEPREPGEVGVLGAPKTWVDADGDFWLSINALVSGGDSSRRLGDVRVTMRSPEGDTIYEIRHDQVVWTSTADFKREVVPARSFHTPPSREEFCEAIRGLGPISDAQLELSITGGNALPFTETYPISDDVIAQARSLCDG